MQVHKSCYYMIKILIESRLNGEQLMHDELSSLSVTLKSSINEKNVKPNSPSLILLLDPFKQLLNQ